MTQTKPVGRGAAARKYDLLTALGAHALAEGKRAERLTLRLITLITARYNWAREELAVGQREIAALWSVDPRTVKREMARLRAMGWLSVRRSGARGRVTEYRLEIDTILAQTRPQWTAVGPDFALRMGAPEAVDGDAAQVVPFPGRAVTAPPDVSDGTEWALAGALMHAEDPGLHAAWIARLDRADRAGGRLILRAPSRFHGAYVQTHLSALLLAACQAVDDTVAEVAIIT